MVFNDTDGPMIVPMLYKWAEFANEPLRSYATGLLAASMSISELAQKFKDQNIHLIPIMLKRLKELSNIDGYNKLAPKQSTTTANNLQRIYQDDSNLTLNNDSTINTSMDSFTATPAAALITSNKREIERMNLDNSSDSEQQQPIIKRFKQTDNSTDARLSSLSGNSLANGILLSPPHLNSECSNSSWAELEPYMIGTFCMYPLTPEMKQRFILQYLTPMGDYQELLCHVFENKAIDLIMHYIDLKKNHDIRLAFESLRYLSSLLCHKKFAIEFLKVGGLQQLLQVYRPSVAATGVSLCLYYLAYNEDAMERICLHPKSILLDLVNYALWLLECSHESSRSQSTMFFSVSFSFRVILELFDAQDGLRKVLNAIFMLDLFKENDDSNDDEIFSKRQTAKLIINALKKYFEAHLIVECEQLRRSQLIKINQITSNHNSNNNTLNLNSKTNFNYNKLTIGNVPAYKAMKYTNETIIEFVETLIEIMPIRKSWKPVEYFINLGGVKLIVNLIVVVYSKFYSSKPEIMKSALDILVVCSALPKLQIVLTEVFQIEFGPRHDDLAAGNLVTPIQVLIDCANKIREEPEVQCSALQILINCCCGPLSRIGSSSTKLFHNSTTNQLVNNNEFNVTSNKNTASSNKKIKTGEDLLCRMWYSVRSSNGIMALLNLLTIKTPITHADKIRLLASKALCGLARSETIKQILVKLTVFTSGQLQQLAKEPILQEKLQEHIQFTKYCLMLIHQVTGSLVSNSIESTSTANLTKAEIVAQTKITYNEKELLSLIYSHLKQKGFKEAADTLLKEVKEASSTTNTKLSWPSSTPTGILLKKTKRPRINLINDCTSTPNADAKHSNSFQLKLTAKDNRSNSPSLIKNSNSNISSSSNNNNNNNNINNNNNNNNNNNSLASLIHAKGTFQFSSTGITPIKNHHLPFSENSNELTLDHNNLSSVNLDSIVTEYLRKQHSQCKHPIYTCPPFDLFKSHQCPEPLYKNSAPVNCALRVARKQIQPRFGGLDGMKWDRQLVYSKFKPIKTFRDPEGISNYSCCAFSHVNQFFFLGTSNGELSVYNLYSSTLEASYSCHNSLITYVEPSKDGKLVITCSIWHNSSVLWTFTDIFEMRISFDDCNYVEFSKNIQDKAIGTTGFTAKLYDLNVNKIVHTFECVDIANRYTKNKATFNYTDELILNDGILWDVRSPTLIHKFDKFNEHINGVFHPNKWEIIANSEIWDLRNYRLLRTIPALDQCHIKFNKTGDVFYAAIYEDENAEEEEQNRSPFDSAFRTFDAYDYSNIATIDVKKNICDLSVDPGDCFVAIIENSNVSLNQDSVCRLYEQGRCKEDDEQDGDEEEDENVSKLNLKIKNFKII